MPPQPSANDLTTLTLEAVRALLRQIARDPAGYPGNTGPIHGTHGSFAAKALNDLLECEALAGIVEQAINEERGVSDKA